MYSCSGKDFSVHIYQLYIESDKPGRPQEELTGQQKQEYEIEIPSRAWLMRDNKGWSQEGVTHKQLVAGLRAYIHNFQQIEFQLRSHHPSKKQEPLAPEAVVRQKLDWESRIEDPEKGEYYARLRYAWDALTYDRLKPGSRAETLAGSTLSAYYSHHRAEGSPHPEVIKLENPIQVRMV